MKNDFYIYNIYQARWLLKQGCKIHDIGYGNKKDVYVLFERNTFTESCMDEWSKRKG